MLYVNVRQMTKNGMGRKGKRIRGNIFDLLLDMHYKALPPYSFLSK